MNSIVLNFVCSLTKMSCEIVCKLRLENDPRDYGSNDIEQILLSSL